MLANRRKMKAVMMETVAAFNRFLDTVEVSFV